MISQAGGHRGGPILPVAVGVSQAQRPHHPAEVVAVHREIGDGLVNVPVLREAVGLSRLPAIAIAIRPVLPLDEGGVD